MLVRSGNISLAGGCCGSALTGQALTIRLTVLTHGNRATLGARAPR